MPEGPVTITSRTSAAVLPTKAMCLAFPELTRSRIYSAPVLVLPYPRPARISHIRQSVSGMRWSGRAQKFQSHLSSMSCFGVRDFSILVLSAGGSKAIDCRHDDFPGFPCLTFDFNCFAIFPCNFLPHLRHKHISATF